MAHDYKAEAIENVCPERGCAFLREFSTLPSGQTWNQWTWDAIVYKLHAFSDHRDCAFAMILSAIIHVFSKSLFPAKNVRSDEVYRATETGEI